LRRLSLQVGHLVVEKFNDDAFLKLNSSDDGRTYAMLPLLTAQLIVLHYEPAAPSSKGSSDYCDCYFARTELQAKSFN